MNNLLIAEQFHQLSKLMELHQENVFKIRAIANAASIIEKLNQEITLDNYQQLSSIKGIGKNILEKIKEILIYGKIKELDEYEKQTPSSVVELLNIRGLGSSKVYKLWKELNITKIDDLLKAAENNELTKLKGFSSKTQQALIENIHFYIQSKNKLQLGIALNIAKDIINLLKQHQINAEITGELRRHCEIIKQIEFITTQKISHHILHQIQQLSSIPVVIHSVNENEYYYKLVETSGSKDFLESIHFYNLSHKKFNSEKEVFASLDTPYILPPQREDISEFFYCSAIKPVSHPIEYTDFKGILHCHSTYSDGVNTLEEMAIYTHQQGFEYLGICDHSQSATYANGLTPERVLEQHQEIEKLNQQFKNFKILKGIESDILKNGNLDYDEDILKQFDFVVASIHSHFEMSEKEATERIIKAIENPYTNILGHLTGRLLLIRKGYPVNHKKIIDACAANKVVIELNANTYRLDIDWRWIRYCVEKGVYIAINPDAHSATAIQDTLYGIMVAQKAGLKKENCINTFDLKDLLKIFKK
jgi:DNA polymerase (family 10)